MVQGPHPNTLRFCIIYYSMHYDVNNIYCYIFVVGMLVKSESELVANCTRSFINTYTSQSVNLKVLVEQCYTLV